MDGLKLLHITSLEMVTCKAIVQEGARTGQGCKFPPSENGYCGRHERNRTYDEGINAGKHWCRFFFRGCDTELTATEIEAKEVTCKNCKERLTKKQYPCEHTGCPFKVKEKGFCKKHERDKYRKEEEEKGIKYCDIARGCFTVCPEGKKSCEECLKKARSKEIERYNKRKQLNQVLQTTTHTMGRVCAQCGKDFESYKTRYGKESLNCKSCQEAQAKQDEKRKDRVRNFKREKFNNIAQYYREYVVGSVKRGYEMNLDFDTFSKLVIAECNYCGHKKEGEVNGIDRVDNAQGYSVENCVTACWKCNRIKYIYHKDFFIEKCRLISKKSMAPSGFFSTWKQYYKQTRYKQFSSYTKEAASRNLPVEITQEQWERITRSPCYICGYQSAKGIGLDRMDNTVRAYTFTNSRACCGPCNNMKGEFSLQELIDQCNIIVTKMIPEEEEEAEAAPAEERKHWKALGLYYAIISDSADSFLDAYLEFYSMEDFKEICKLVKESTKEAGIKTLRTLLQTIKKKKYRLSIGETR